jgi:molybdenum cofactor synthesis domain-containing protein
MSEAPRSARVIVASNRASAGVYEDTAGPLIAAWLTERGFATPDPIVVPDGAPVTAALRSCLGDDAVLIITTGGTGVSPTDRTPEATRPVLDYEVPGLAEAIRAAGVRKVPTAMLSRGRAGVAGTTLIVNLPGSRGGVKDGLAVLDDVLEHALDQIAGGDHPRATGQSAPATQGAVPTPQIMRAEITREPISADEHAQLVQGDGSGAVVTFAGVVRNHDKGRNVDRLDYESHPTADDMLAAVLDEVAARHRVHAIAASHRVGELKTGDVALACAVAAAHRAEAFAACAELVDTAKARLPIWKHQVFGDGTDEWVNSP